MTSPASLHTTPSSRPLTAERRQSFNREATEFTGACLVAITALPQTFAWRSNSGVAVAPTRQIIRVNVAGIGDITGGRRGRAFSIECKLRSGRPNDNQARFRKAWEAAGNLYIVARTVEQAVDELVAAT